MNASQLRYVVRFRGQVQCVGFRANALSQSIGLRVRGFVRNRGDGSVELDVVGPESELRELLKRIEESMKGNIDDREIETLPAEERADEFRIRYS